MKVFFNILKKKGIRAHSSLLPENTAADKMSRLISRIENFRSSQIEKLKKGGCTLGEIYSANITSIRMGEQLQTEGEQVFELNVIPSTCIVGVNLRVPPTARKEEVDNLLKEWTRDDSINYSFQFESSIQPPIKIEGNPWLQCIESSMKNLGVNLKKDIFPGGTDSTYIREKGIISFGFSPIKNTTVLMHGDNEFLGRKTFLEGIGVYEELITSLANLKKHKFD